MIRKLEHCRLCNSQRLESVLDVGVQNLTGLFPRENPKHVPAGPLQLVKCSQCDLVQLAHSYDLNQLYGHTYGYRSGLNRSMVSHLQGKVRKILESYKPQKGDLILDIGSNDSTLLQAYPEGEFVLAGIDPLGTKFKNYYPKSIQLIPDFFSAFHVRKQFGGKKARVITSIAMFYDLEDPIGFAQEISDILTEDGVWVFEQSYLPAMLEQTSYDTICHEHIEYYALKQVLHILNETGLKAIDLEFNDANGGAFSVTAAKKESHYKECSALIEVTLKNEEKLGLSTLAPYRSFAQRMEERRRDLLTLLEDLKSQGKTVFGYGASTKGNVLLQFCGIGPEELPCIAEVNEEKFGSYTPGTGIPIVSESKARSMKPDYFLVLPWHFKESIIKRESEFLKSGGHFVFPLPRVEVFP